MINTRTHITLFSYSPYEIHTYIKQRYITLFFRRKEEQANMAADSGHISKHGAETRVPDTITMNAAETETVWQQMYTSVPHIILAGGRT